MADALDRLTAALADRYRIERELGAGGMATVYLAEDLKHHRKVAVKVLRGEIAATLGAERFSREISVAANLQHPHILPLLDSGESAGFFYYVMPYIEGESLRDRLARHGELPIHEAVRIVSEVADALTHAHARGVVHRDIKPDNIMLSGRHAMVTDFGVAKAVSEATGPHHLTSIGVALGTPSYMAPEQAAADPHLDHRVDIYALGILAYELLTGRPPFEGLTPQQVLAAHVTQVPDPVEKHRPGVSPALSAVVMKCLAKRAADRWQSAEELVQQLEPLTTPSGGMTPTQTRPTPAVSFRPRSRGMYLGAAALVAVVLGLGVWQPWNRSAGRALDPDLVAVLPFRVAGTDASLQYLRQGMVDLLQTKLTGEGGPRAADARAVLAAVRDAGGTETEDISEEALATVARRIGAGKLLQGSIVGPPDHIVISATLLGMPGGRTITQTSVEGTKDSLFPLVDRLTAQLLALGAGASANQLSELTTTSLEALRAYLDGQAAYRRGAFDVATPTLTRAVQLDSTFALALSALVEASGWSGARIDMSRVERLAWQYRDRLSERDRLFLSIRLGSGYPEFTPWQQRIADREALTQRIPESAEAWYYLGDGLFHFGALADVPDIENRARLAFTAAVERDSLYGGPLAHLARLEAVAGDTSAQRFWTRRSLALDSTGSVAIIARWDLASKTGDPIAAERIIASDPHTYAPGIVLLLPFDTNAIVHRESYLARAYRATTTNGDRANVAEIAIDALLNAGRPLEVARWLDTLQGIDRGRWAVKVVLGAVVTGSDTLDLDVVQAHPSPFITIIAATLRGDVAGVEGSARALRSPSPEGTPPDPYRARFAALGEAWVAVHRNDPSADRLLAVADSTWKGVQGFALWSSFTLSRLFERHGQPELALRAIRRRYVALGEPLPNGLAQSLLIEGRLAARVGDRAGAIQAYQRYLILRRDPEPSMIPKRDSVIAELTALGPQEGRR